MSKRWRKPSERCASATRPSGALSLRHEMTAAPTLRKCPSDQTHFWFSHIVLELSATSSGFCPDVEASLHTKQFVLQIILRGFFQRDCSGCAPVTSSFADDVSEWVYGVSRKATIWPENDQRLFSCQLRGTIVRPLLNYASERPLFQKNHNVQDPSIDILSHSLITSP